LRRAYDFLVSSAANGERLAGEWLADFEAAARRPLALRWRYSFIRTYKPVLDDADYRSFETTAEYRRWSRENLPSWLGYPDTTQDADLFVAKDPDNGRALVSALREIGFSLNPEQEAEIIGGMDFIQLKNGPFDLDLVFAPDGIERFDDAFSRRIVVEGFPVCHIDDIIASKEASGRARDRESLPRLKAFREYWMHTNR
jgi:hypothetical protein